MIMDKITIRRAGVEDCETVLRLTDQLFTELSHTPPIADFVHSAAFCTGVLKNGYLVLLAVDRKGRVAGILTMDEGVSLYARGRFGIIREFYVVPVMRSKGIGSALLQEAKALAQEKGWKRIEVTSASREDHSRPYSFYIREGFREMGPRLIRTDLPRGIVA